VPRTKAGLTLSYNLNAWNFFIRNTYFGEVEEATTTPAFLQTFDAKIVTDASVGYKFSKGVRLSIGANNLLDVYPEKVAEPGNTGSNQFIFSRRATQFGYNGRYLFGRLELNF
jgi:iron complex outermembrane receptor protein